MMLKIRGASGYRGDAAMAALIHAQQAEPDGRGRAGLARSGVLASGQADRECAGCGAADHVGVGQAVGLVNTPMPAGAVVQEFKQDFVTA
jgi:hypothetical protein